ncbi:hypothetical protein BafHLJ01_0227 [Borreliella afzelii HLJ01]|nr:hypothetical protein BafHLJ01_0227 [Borreliella afzelii HLJ01]
MLFLLNHYLSLIFFGFVFSIFWAIELIALGLAVILSFFVVSINSSAIFF